MENTFLLRFLENCILTQILESKYWRISQTLPKAEVSYVSAPLNKHILEKKSIPEGVFFISAKKYLHTDHFPLSKIQMLYNRVLPLLLNKWASPINIARYFYFF